MRQEAEIAYHLHARNRLLPSKLRFFYVISSQVEKGGHDRSRFSETGCHLAEGFMRLDTHPTGV